MGISLLFLSATSFKAGSILILKKKLQLIHKCVYILKLSVYRSESDVCNLINILELIHNKFTNICTADLGLQGIIENGFNIPLSIFERSNASLDLSFLTTSIGITSSLSYVVNLFWQERHSLLRLIAPPSSVGRESRTLLSAKLQAGHFI